MDTGADGGLSFDGVNGEETDNVVTYSIHQLDADSGAKLEDVRRAVLETVSPFLKGYIWQRQTLNLHLSTEHPAPWQRSVRKRASTSETDAPMEFLWGEVSFGDNIQDEWFIVSLLLQVTLKHPELCARVWDNDGEFLLIETAYSLPKWVKPEVAENRVILHKGSLHLIPLPSPKHPTVPMHPSLPEALAILRSLEPNTKASEQVQSMLQSRLAGLPHNAMESMHRARVCVPRGCAAILDAQPQLVGAAVEAFYTRDVEDMKAAVRQQHFPPQDMVTVLCTFNRCMYAQLHGQVWEPTKKYPMPSIDNPAHKAALLGAKLVAGMEMFLCRTLKAARQDVRRSATTWDGLHSCLAGLLHIQGEIPGSREYMRQEAEARDQFESAVEAGGDSGPGYPELLCRILPQSVNKGGVPATADSPSPAAAPAAEDDDSWLTSAAEDLEKQMQQREKELDAYMQKRGGAEKQAGGAGEADEQVEIESLARQMDQFLNHVSGVEGAEVPIDSGSQGGISLDPAQFFEHLESVLGVKFPTDLGEQQGRRGSGEGEGDAESVSSSSEGSSFFSEGDENDSSGSEADAASPGVGGFTRDGDWDARTATDSDDESRQEGDFMHAYDAEMAEQLRGTTVAATFAESSTEGAESGLKKENEQSPTADASERPKELKPVDLDVNLISNMLESLASQEGLPGPASNIAGMLGIKLPR